MNRTIRTVTATVALAASVLALAQSQDDPMSKVESIIQQSHQIQNARRAEARQQQAAAKAQSNFANELANSTRTNAKQEWVSQNSPAPQSTISKAPPPVQPVSVASSNNADEVKALQTQIADLNQANAMFQQQTDQRIDVLNQEHTALQRKLSQVGQVLSMLNQEVSQLGQQIQSAQAQLGEAGHGTHALSASATESWAQKLEHTPPIQYILYAILVLLAIIILMLIPRRAKPRMQTVTAESVAAAANDGGTTDTKDEYDFMGTAEAIPAKLDLARAYMAMEDFKSAEKVLRQVLQVGDDAQCREAKDMLAKIPKQ